MISTVPFADALQSLAQFISGIATHRQRYGAARDILSPHIKMLRGLPATFVAARIIIFRLSNQLHKNQM
jgi:hypothetical protein